MNKISSILKKAERYGFYSMELDNYPHRACRYINNGIFCMQVCFDFESILLNWDNIKTVKCGFYENGAFKLKNMITKVRQLMKEKKKIFIINDIKNYFSKLSKYDEHHSTAIILLPKKGAYYLYYINSHGYVMVQYKKYMYKISKTRGTELRFKETIDLLFIKNIISRIDVNIVYDTTKKHNYYGPNIQLGDNHGICFVFPFAMLIYISKNFKTCFKRFDINSFVCNSLDINVDFDTTVTINLIGRKELIRLTHLSTDAIRKNIAIKKFLFKKKIFFIKRITNYVIEVLTEKRLRDYIKSAYTPPRLPED